VQGAGLVLLQQRVRTRNAACNPAHLPSVQPLLLIAHLLLHPLTLTVHRLLQVLLAPHPCSW
jgi:hypothetical protein